MGETKQQLSLLERTVTESGGNVVEISGPHQVAEAFAGILSELRNQLAIGYYPEPRYDDGRWRELKVKTTRVGVRLRHASGYFDD